MATFGELLGSLPRALSPEAFDSAVIGTRAELIAAIRATRALKDGPAGAEVFAAYTVDRVKTQPLKSYIAELGLVEYLLAADLNPLLTFASRLRPEEHPLGMYIKAQALTQFTNGRPANPMDHWLDIWTAIGGVYAEEPRFLERFVELHINHAPPEANLDPGVDPRVASIANLAETVRDARSAEAAMPLAS